MHMAIDYRAALSRPNIGNSAAGRFSRVVLQKRTHFANGFYRAGI